MLFISREMVPIYFSISSVSSDWCTWNQFFFAAPKQHAESCPVLPPATTIFKSNKKARGEPTDLAKYQYINILPWEAKEMCTELFLMHWYQIRTQFGQIRKFGYRNRYQEEKKVSEHPYTSAWLCYRSGLAVSSDVTSSFLSIVTHLHQTYQTK